MGSGDREGGARATRRHPPASLGTGHGLVVELDAGSTTLSIGVSPGTDVPPAWASATLVKRRVCEQVTSWLYSL